VTGPSEWVRPDAVFERLWLDERSWVDVCRGWLGGADDVYRAVAEQAAWRQGRVFRYERWVDEPRLGTSWSPGSPLPHPALLEAHRSVRERYGKPFEGFALAWYRDGRDSVAFHRDRDLRFLDDTVICLLTLGARRPWLLRPRSNRYAHDADHHGATHDLSPGPGDLHVMGGACQAGWEHAVPKVPGLPTGRISVQWRWTSGTGRPVVGASYRAARTYSRPG
jgi:alkylated DNA repair dioxygenase AlkB